MTAGRAKVRGAYNTDSALGHNPLSMVPRRPGLRRAGGGPLHPPRASALDPVGDRCWVAQRTPVRQARPPTFAQTPRPAGTAPFAQSHHSTATRSSGTLGDLARKWELSDNTSRHTFSECPDSPAPSWTETKARIDAARSPAVAFQQNFQGRRGRNDGWGTHCRNITAKFSRRGAVLPSHFPRTGGPNSPRIPSSADPGRDTPLPPSRTSHFRSWRGLRTWLPAVPRGVSISGSRPIKAIKLGATRRAPARSWPPPRLRPVSQDPLPAGRRPGRDHPRRHADVLVLAETT